MAEDMSDPREGSRAVLTIHRGADAPPLSNAQQRLPSDPAYVADPVIQDGSARLRAAGIGAGVETRVLFCAPHLHVTYVWGKAGLPIPVHSHSVDCYYQVVAGSMRFGTEELHAGDGAFVPADVAYSFTPGAEGAEFLEIRTGEVFDTRFRSRNKHAWDKAVETVSDLKEQWRDARPPLGMVQL